MTIACLIHSLGIGGMERVMAILLRHFAEEEEIEIHVVLFGREREVLQTIPNTVKVHRPAWAFDNKKRTWHILKSIAFVRRTVKAIHPDTILSFGEIWNNLALLALIGLSYPVFISDRSKPNKDLGRLQNMLRDLLYPQANGYIAQTQQAKDIALQKGWNTNIRVIGNPVPAMDCQQDRENVILSVGRLIPTKNFDRLIHLFSHLENAEDWKLCIVGGNAKQLNISRQLAQQVAALKLEGRVMLEGLQTNVKSYYCRSKIFAFMSTSEGFPNVLGEAMAAGCACIAYDCSAGPADLIEDITNGFLIEENNEQDFLDKIQRLIDDNELRKKYSENAQESIQKFNAENISKLYLDFISSHQPS